MLMTKVVSIMDVTTNALTVVLHEASKSSDGRWLQFLPLVISMLAVVVGPIVMLLIAKRQITASVVSANRQAWIKDLRDEIATLIAEYERSIHRLHVIKLEGHSPESVSRFLEFMHNANRCQLRIELLLNPTEHDHSRLTETISAFIASMSEFIDDPGSPRDPEKMKVAKKEILRLAQAIFKREWERVKAGG